MRNATFTNTANSIINSLRSELDDERNKVFQRIDDTEASILNALTATSGSESEASAADTASTLTEHANSTTQDKVNIEILKLLKEIHMDMKNSKPTTDPNEPKRKRTRRRTDTRFYCWSCGAWNHKSKDCKRKKDGYKDDATFDNKMGSSTYYCAGK